MLTQHLHNVYRMSTQCLYSEGHYGLRRRRNWFTRSLVLENFDSLGWWIKHFLAFDMFHPFPSFSIFHFCLSSFSIIWSWKAKTTLVSPVLSLSCFIDFNFFLLSYSPIYVWQALKSNEVAREPSQLDKHLLCGPGKPRQLQRYDKDNDYKDWL